jgi:hypothetical protein
MKRLSFLLPIAICAAFLTGCASPVSGPEYSSAKDTLPAPNPDSGRIFIYRTDVIGSLVQPPVRINGDEAGTARCRGFFYVDLPAGTYRIDTGSKDEEGIHVSLAKGQVLYVRLKFSADPFGIYLDPEVVGAERAQDEMANCRLTKR